MAWTPPTKTIGQMGEMPNKKKMTSQQSARMDANTPVLDPEFAIGDVAIESEEYVSVFDPSTVNPDILEVLDELRKMNVGIGQDVFHEDFDIKIEDQMFKMRKSFDIQEAIRVAGQRELIPADFYFGIGNNDKNGTFCIVVPKRVWDTTYNLTDESWAVFMPEDQFIEFEPCKYHFAGSNTAQKAREKLTKMGCAENKDMRF
jgi:hypothetical protein